MPYCMVIQGTLCDAKNHHSNATHLLKEISSENGILVPPGSKAEWKVVDNPVHIESTEAFEIMNKLLRASQKGT